MSNNNKDKDENESYLKRHTDEEIADYEESQNVPESLGAASFGIGGEFSEVIQQSELIEIFNLGHGLNLKRSSVYSNKDILDNLSKIPSRTLTVSLVNPLSNNIKAVIDDWGLDMNSTGVAFCAMQMNLLELPGSKAPEKFRETEYLRYGDYSEDMRSLKEGKVLEIYKGKIITDMPDSEEYEFCCKVYDLIDTAFKWNVDLAACYQTKNINAKNVESYFLAESKVRINGKILYPLIEWMSNLFPRIMDHGEMRTKLSKTKFMRYHTTAVSTPLLVKKVYNSLGTIKNKIFSTETIEIIDEALSCYWDLEKTERIPKDTIVFTKLFLIEFKIEVGDWYQGSRALSEAAINTVNKMKLFIKKFKELTIDMENYDGISDENSLVSRFTKNMDKL